MQTANKLNTWTFINRSTPLRSPHDFKSIFLCYPMSDFGGEYFRYVPSVQKPGTYFAWYRFNSPYTDGSSYSYFLGEFSDVETLQGLLETSSPETGELIISKRHHAEIIANLTDAMGWTVEAD